jgi:hypothetical protein
MKYRAILLLALNSCASRSQDIIHSELVKKIEIRNGTNNRYISDHITVTKRVQIDELVTEVNRMKPLDSDVGVKSNFGDYDMRIEMQDGSEKVFFIVYTAYDGVIIQGYNKSETAMNQFYKNDRLEMAILSLFDHK